MRNVTPQGDKNNERGTERADGILSGDPGNWTFACGPHSYLIAGESDLSSRVIVETFRPDGDRFSSRISLASSSSREHYAKKVTDDKALRREIENDLNAAFVAIQDDLLRREAKSPTYRPQVQDSDPCTDLANAKRFREATGGLVLYVPAWRKWLVWDGVRWKEDDMGEIWRYAEEAARSIYHEVAETQRDEYRKRLLKWARESQNGKRLREMLFLAGKLANVPVRVDRLDSDPWLLCIDNGVVDLRTAELRSPNPKLLLTKRVAVEWQATTSCRRWKRFLLEIMGGNRNLVRYLKRAVGYSLTGDTRERNVFILHGAGRNGKSTLLEIIRALLGDYAMKTPVQTLLARRGDGIPNDIARLRGARFVYASEGPEGQQLNEGLVKDLTGREHISARFLYGEFFDFSPQFKLWLGTNHKPIIRGSDPAIWDRIHLIPFDVRFEGKAEDKELPSRLRAELPGILQWAVEGCIEWQERGLDPPEEVRAATSNYRQEMDLLGEFLAAQCLESPEVRSNVTAFFQAFSRWCEDNGERAPGRRALSSLMEQRGFRRHKSSDTYWLGVGVLSPGPEQCGSLGHSESPSQEVSLAGGFSTGCSDDSTQTTQDKGVMGELGTNLRNPPENNHL